MSENKRRWPGLVNIGKYVLYGNTHSKPITQNDFSPDAGTPTTSETYSSMDKNYRWFRQDELIRRATVLNAMFATKSKGFETRLAPRRDGEDVDAWNWVLDEINTINQKVNMDNVLYQAQIKRSIFGWSGFDILSNMSTKLPYKMLPLRSEYLEPEVNRFWQLESFKYQGKHKVYKPDEVFYFQNTPLEGDFLGLSDIEPIRKIAEARKMLLKENFPEILKTLWAPFTVMEVDTSMVPDDDVVSTVNAVAKIARSGKSTAINESIKAHSISISPDITGLVKLLDKLDQSIIGNYGTPRFLFGSPIETRATAFAELETYIQGDIDHIQTGLKRTIEPWYQRWGVQILKNNGYTFPRNELPFNIKHHWRTVRVVDFYEMAKSVSALYGKGEGPLGRHVDETWKLLNLDADTMAKKMEIDKALNNPNPEELTQIVSL